jgi:hypothetical protein
MHSHQNCSRRVCFVWLLQSLGLSGPYCLLLLHSFRNLRVIHYVGSQVSRAALAAWIPRKRYVALFCVFSHNTRCRSVAAVKIC